MTFEIEGADQLFKLSTLLRLSGAKLQRDAENRVTRVVDSLGPQVKREWLVRMPRSGGLNRRIAASRFTTRKGRMDGSFTVRLTATNKNTAIRKIEDTGIVRHLVFGRPPWVRQDVPRGIFNEVMIEALPGLNQQIQEVLDDITRQIDLGMH